jgi:hypothetical protein
MLSFHLCLGLSNINLYCHWVFFLRFCEHLSSLPCILLTELISPYWLISNEDPHHALFIIPLSILQHPVHKQLELIEFSVMQFTSASRFSSFSFSSFSSSRLFPHAHGPSSDTKQIIQDCNFACGSIWLWNLVSDIIFIFNTITCIRTISWKTDDDK